MRVRKIINDLLVVALFVSIFVLWGERMPENLFGWSMAILFAVVAMLSVRICDAFVKNSDSLGIRYPLFGEKLTGEIYGFMFILSTLLFLYYMFVIFPVL